MIVSANEGQGQRFNLKNTGKDGDKGIPNIQHQPLRKLAQSIN